MSLSRRKFLRLIPGAVAAAVSVGMAVESRSAVKSSRELETKADLLPFYDPYLIDNEAWYLSPRLETKFRAAEDIGDWRATWGSAG